VTGIGSFFMTCYGDGGTRQWTERWGAASGAAYGIADGGVNVYYVGGAVTGGFDNQSAVGSEDLWASAWVFGSGPRILSGPDVSEITHESAILGWMTDMNCEGIVQYGRTNGYWEGAVTNTTYQQEQQVTLGGLLANTGYSFLVRATDPFGRTVQSNGWFSTLPPPAISNLGVCGTTWPFLFNLQAAPNVDRVEFNINNQHLGTMYGPPFDYEVDESVLTLFPGLLLETHSIGATSFDAQDQVIGMAGSVWDRWLEGMITSVDIDQP